MGMVGGGAPGVVLGWVDGAEGDVDGEREWGEAVRASL